MTPPTTSVDRAELERRQKTFDSFITFTKLGIIGVATLLIGMALFLVG